MRVVAVLVAVGLSGCSTTVPFPLASDTTVRVKVLGDIGRECVIEPSSDAHGKLKYWLAENQTGWSQLHYTPPNGGVLLSTPQIQLQLFGDTAYATVPLGILTKHVSESDYAFVVCKSGA